MENQLDKYIAEYSKQLESGHLQLAYRGIIEYISGLKHRLATKYPTHFTAGTFYQGCMDITYFPFTPESLKNKSLKVAIVFNHEKIRFEIWLVGQNKQVQEKYWKIFKKNNLLEHLLSPTPEDSIVEKILVEHPVFDEPDLLTKKIETEIMEFTKDIIVLFSSLDDKKSDE